MNKYRRALAILGLAAAMAFMSACSSGFDQADTILYGGTVVTVDDSNPSAEAIAIKDGKIVAVGSEAKVMAWRGDDTEVVNIAGRTVVPGFIDGHSHFVAFGAQAVGANLLAPPDGQVENIADLVEALKGFGNGPDVDRTGWIFGMGYDDAVLAEGRHPTADDLDKVSTEIPVMAVHISGHFSAVNSVALKKIAYSSETQDPDGGIIRRRPGTREPNGVFEELASIPITLSVITPTTEDNQVSDGGELTARYAVSRQSLLLSNVGRQGNTFETKARVEGDLGYLTEASATLAARWGRIESPWWDFAPSRSNYLPQPPPKSSDSLRGPGGHEFYVWSAITLRARGYNAFLQGQFRDSEVTLSSSDLNHILGEISVGLSRRFGDAVDADLTLACQTSEIKHGIGSEKICWGGLTIRKSY